MQPGLERAPEWMVGIFSLLLLAIILLGGWWLTVKEKKDREKEKRQIESNDSEKAD